MTAPQLNPVLFWTCGKITLEANRYGECPACASRLVGGSQHEYAPELTLSALNIHLPQADLQELIPPDFVCPEPPLCGDDFLYKDE